MPLQMNRGSCNGRCRSWWSWQHDWAVFPQDSGKWPVLCQYGKECSNGCLYMSHNNGAYTTVYYSSPGGKAELGLLTCNWVDISSLTTETQIGGLLENVLNGQNWNILWYIISPVGFYGERADRVGSYTSGSASPGDRMGFDWTPVWIFQTRRSVNKHSTRSSGLCSLSRVWFGIQDLQAMSGHFWKLPSQKQFNWTSALTLLSIWNRKCCTVIATY